MKRVAAAVVVVTLAGLAIFLETDAIRAGFAEWLAAGALPPHGEMVAAIDLPSTGGIRALDAALALRAVLRCEPKAIVFLDPIAPGGGEGEALLLSKLGDAKVPVVFTANEKLDPLPQVAISDSLPPLPKMAAALPAGHPAGGATTTEGSRVLIAARQENRAVPSNVWQFCMALESARPAGVTGKVPGRVRACDLSAPVDSAGGTTINPLAARFERRIDFDQLMLRTERSEQGSISVDLDILFRGNLVAVQNAGGNRALGVAALRNRLVESRAPVATEWIALLLAATLPWWPGGRWHRALFALGVSCGWALMALAIYQEFRVVAPLLVMLLLPLLALIPPGNRAQGGNEGGRPI